MFKCLYHPGRVGTRCLNLIKLNSYHFFEYLKPPTSIFIWVPSRSVKERYPLLPLRLPNNSYCNHMVDIVIYRTHCTSIRETAVWKSIWWSKLIFAIDPFLQSTSFNWFDHSIVLLLSTARFLLIVAKQRAKLTLTIDLLSYCIRKHSC